MLLQADAETEKQTDMQTERQTSVTKQHNRNTKHAQGRHYINVNGTNKPAGKTPGTGPTCPRRCCAPQRRLPVSWKHDMTKPTRQVLRCPLSVKQNTSRRGAIDNNITPGTHGRKAAPLAKQAFKINAGMHGTGTQQASSKNNPKIALPNPTPIVIISYFLCASTLE